MPELTEEQQARYEVWKEQHMAAMQNILARHNAWRKAKADARRAAKAELRKKNKAARKARRKNR